MATVYPVIRPIIAHSFSPMAIFYTESCVKRKDVCVCVCVCVCTSVQMFGVGKICSSYFPQKKKHCKNSDIVKHCYKLKLLLYFHMTFLMKCIPGITPVFSVIILCKNHSILFNVEKMGVFF